MLSRRRWDAAAKQDETSPGKVYPPKRVRRGFMGKPEGLGWAGIKLGDLLEKSCSWTTGVPAAVVTRWLMRGPRK